MIWAPCFAASWAYCSCFWIIDSLSPVQVAWTRAPRTTRDMLRSSDLDVTTAPRASGLLVAPQRTPASGKGDGARWSGRRRCSQGSPPSGIGSALDPEAEPGPDARDHATGPPAEHREPVEAAEGRGVVPQRVQQR